MHRDRATPVVYGLAAAICSLFMFARHIDSEPKLTVASLTWLVSCAIPLAFAFAYSRFVFQDPPTLKRPRSAVLTNAACAIAGIIGFVALLSYSNNAPDLNDSFWFTTLLLAMAVLAFFLVSAIFLLIKKRSNIKSLAAFLLCPYWFFLALSLAGFRFRGAGSHPEFFYIAFITPVLFALASGASVCRLRAGHLIALSGFIAFPWMYWNVLRDTGLGNVWLVFNEPGPPLGMTSSRDPLYAVLAISAVASLVVAISMAAFRLLPSTVRFGTFPVRESAWLPFASSLAVLIVWFSRSVTPYRIPGALDYADSPILQILHVEKHGLQFHERCVKVWGRVGQISSVSFSGDDRRLFQYGFLEKKETGGELSNDLENRIHGAISSSLRSKESELIHPVRAWNADAWYTIGGHSGLEVYGIEGKAPPPAQIVSLFHDLEALPHSAPQVWPLKDVCLGFCYDPVSAMGYLYANRRCFNAGHGMVCR